MAGTLLNVGDIVGPNIVLYIKQLFFISNSSIDVNGKSQKGLAEGKTKACVVFGSAGFFQARESSISLS
jgi:hypothetical protein